MHELTKASMSRGARTTGMRSAALWILCLGGLAAAADSKGMIGADGLTVDPTTLEAYNALRLWQPKAPPAAAATRPYRTKIVSYCDEWGRHGASGHGGGPEAWRHARRRNELAVMNKPPRGEEPWPYTRRRDRDVDGDGKTHDDMIVSLEWSMDEMLSIYPWPHGGLFPERSSQVFYGGVSWLGANVPDDWKHSSEMGINADHGPWHRAEDHPLTGVPDFKQDGSFHRNYWCVVWKKEDFMNQAGRYRVTFDDTSRLASICTRNYWIGWDDVRMVALDGKQWYISDNKSFDIPKPNNGPGLPGKDYARGRVFMVHPTQVTWAKYQPKGSRIDFGAKGAEFAKHDFKDVQAVGWYIAKNNDLPISSHVKWYGFEADAVVHRPVTGSTHIDMVEVKDQDVPAFRMSTCEVPYAMWRKVHRYGNSPWAPLDARYVYRKNGDMGSMQRSVAKATYSQDEPVTNMTFYDALAFCNTLSEKEGRIPCYYEDPEFKTIFRNMHYGTRGKAAEDGPWPPKITYDQVPEPKIYVRWGADGHRLPTRSEWMAAYTSGKTKSDVAFATIGANSDGKTQAVGSRKANALGIYDMIGNVWELVWMYGDGFDPAAGGAVTALGGDFQYPADPNAKEASASPYGDNPYEGNFNIGLRLVSREANLPAPAKSDARADVPEWTIRKGHRTAARQEAVPQADGAPAMVKLEGGSFLRYPNRITISINPFEAGKFEVTYAEWVKVFHWAAANGYEFSYDGDMGSMYWYTFPHSPEEPVTHITFHDMLIWCNALSEMGGKTPCYYADEARTRVYRKSFVLRPLKVSGPEYVDTENVHPWIGKLVKGRIEKAFSNSDPWLFCRWDVDGYRLPTGAEWEYAVRGGTGTPYFWGTDDAQKAKYAWGLTNAGGRTHCVGLKQPNPFGLFDMCGNVEELVWSDLRHISPLRPKHLDLENPKESPYWVYDLRHDLKRVRAGKKVYNPFPLGGSWLCQGFNYNGPHGVAWHYGGGTHTTYYFPDLGFRLARCEAGTHPRDGKEELTKEVFPELVKVDRAQYDPLEGKMFRGGLARTGVHDASGVAKLGGVKWTVNLGGPVRSSPVVVDGVVYVGGGDGFYAFNANDGKELWKTPIKGGSESSACVADGVAYFCGNDGALRAVDTETGQEVWTYRPKRPVPSKSSPALAYGVVFATLDGLVGIDAKTGEKVWSCKAAKGSGSEWLASMSIVGDTIYYTGNGTWTPLRGINISDAQEKWTAPVGHAGLYNTPAVANDRVYAVCSTGLAAHPIRQAKDLKGFGAHPDPDIGVNQFKTNSSPAVWGELLIFGMDRGGVYGYSALSGESTWTFATGKPVRSSPCVASTSGLVYFGCNNGNVYCLDAKTGEKKWEHATGGAVVSSPWPADGVIYVGSDDGHIYALKNE